MNPHERGHVEPGLAGVLRRLIGPAGPEVTCEECFAVLDQYVEIEITGGEADARIPGMRAHLEGCPACHEDHESLRDLAGDLAATPPWQGA